jgi:hypothetical protein
MVSLIKFIIGIFWITLQSIPETYNNKSPNPLNKKAAPKLLLGQLLNLKQNAVQPD